MVIQLDPFRQQLCHTESLNQQYRLPVVRMLRRRPLQQGRFRVSGKVMIPLTNKRQDLVCYGQIPVLYHRFRMEGLRYRRRRTARKSAKTVPSFRECHTVNDEPHIPHVFLPYQANFAFHRDNKPKEGQRQLDGLPHPPGSTGSHRIRGGCLPSNNTGHDLSVWVARSTGMDAHI